MTAHTALAPAKVNLTLRIAGRRADGYHELESLVAFAPFGDRLTFWPGAPLDLKVSGPTAAGAGPLTDNLVLRAVRAVSERIDGLTLGRFTLSKRLPSGAGLGGGSSDAGAALRLIAEVNDLALDDARIRDAARVTGADIPVCIDPRPRMMRGIGEILSAPIDLPRIGIVVVHPGIAVATGPVFKALGLAPGQPVAGASASSYPALEAASGGERARREALLLWLASERNDLEAAAISIAPAIADVLAALRQLPGCRLARMSGSGSACFGLFDSVRAATAAARSLAPAHPPWWVHAGRLGA